MEADLSPLRGGGVLEKQYKERLTKAMVGEGGTMNYSYYEGKGINPRELIDLAETMPFFAERRLIVVENSGFFKSASPELADYLKSVPETTCFLFVEEEIDKRGRLYKAVKANGRIVELGRQEEATLTRWILGMVKREEKQIAESTVRYFLAKSGTDMENLRNELEKLFAYTWGREIITVEDVDAVCTTQIVNHIFDMVNAVAEKQQKRALELYYDLLALKEPPMRILFLLVRQFRLLMEVKELDASGYGRKEIGEKTGLHGFVVGKYQSQARAFSAGELREILETAADIEERVKTGGLADSLGAELFIVKYSMA